MLHVWDTNESHEQALHFAGKESRMTSHHACITRDLPGSLTAAVRMRSLHQQDGLREQCRNFVVSDE